MDAIYIRPDKSGIQHTIKKQQKAEAARYKQPEQNMTVTTKFSVGDTVIFDCTRRGRIVGFEILRTMREPDYTKPCYPQYKDNTEIRYQIEPVDGGERLYGSMRHEDVIARVTE